MFDITDALFDNIRQHITPDQLALKKNGSGFQVDKLR